MFSDRSNITNIEISDGDIRNTAPAVFAEAPMPGASTRYTFLPTGQIVTAMRAEGWKPVEARQMGVRRMEHSGFQRHMVRFQRRDVIAEVDEFAPEVILLNSHDRTSGYQIHAGLFRFVCRNGLLVADSLIPSIHVRHTGHEVPEIIKASFQILGQLPLLAERVASFRKTLLSESTAKAFASQALELRYTDPNRAPIRGEQLLAIRRSEDCGNDLWAVANRVQENLLRGGLRDADRRNREGKPFRPMRAIRGLQANVKLNLGIWALAESFRHLN
jgi:Domain of unknown function (DUF932)